MSFGIEIKDGLGNVIVSGSSRYITIVGSVTGTVSSPGQCVTVNFPGLDPDNPTHCVFRSMKADAPFNIYIKPTVVLDGVQFCAHPQMPSGSRSLAVDVYK